MFVIEETADTVDDAFNKGYTEEELEDSLRWTTDFIKFVDETSTKHIEESAMSHKFTIDMFI